MNKKLLIFGILFFMFSCDDSSTDQNTDQIITIVKNFPCEQNLQGEKILADQFYENGSIDVLDTLLLIGIYKDTVKYNIYGVNSLQHLGTLGVVGDGPDEWNAIFHVNQYEVNQHGIMLWCADVLKGLLLKVNLSKVIQAKSPKPIIEKTMNIKADIFPFNQLIYVNDEKVIGNLGYDEVNGGRIKSFNPQKQELIKKVEFFPKIKNAQIIPPMVLYNFYFAGFKKHPSKELFVQSMSLFNRIDIFDANLELIKSIVSGENWDDNYYDAKKMDIMGAPLKGITDGYSDLSVTKNFIFAALENKKMNAAGEVKESQIKVFDWEGNPKCLIRVPDDLFAISVDAKEEYLYANDFNHEKILRYNIKKLAKEWKK
ncbi:MAG: BF3164 family lipoprotein [Microscillaceae bacterium]|nr:BF3164 family lipoprotein [Microscillaceae bacterium]